MNGETFGGKGDFSFPFRFELPSRIPPSFYVSSGGSHCSVRYKLRVELVDPSGGWFGGDSTWHYDIPISVVNPPSPAVG